MLSERKKNKGILNQHDAPNSICSDFVFTYSRAITWAGLNPLCRRNAVRETDGDALMKYWKLELITTD